MSQCATVIGASAADRLARLIQKRVFGDRVKIPLEVRLWGGRTYRFGDTEPAVNILVKDRPRTRHHRPLRHRPNRFRRGPSPQVLVVEKPSIQVVNEPFSAPAHIPTLPLASVR
ncbi:hypothetical protein [Allochromatium palmeri]|uniref:hypothetical protein n=1 Tax=Allochromatium palmeri TaxID=231048 RepID=UPI001FE8CA68|nr:hypothetical protein [Allochromatium palmeri]